MARWLDDDEQRAWRAWVAATSLLTDRLNRDLQHQHGLTLADYEILVRLSEAPQGRLRMSELAGRALSSRSRLSHQVARMTEAGLVARTECADDRRGAFAVLTDRGWHLLREAAPDHVESVRSHLLDVLGRERFLTLGESCASVAAHLGATDARALPDACATTGAVPD